MNVIGCSRPRLTTSTTNFFRRCRQFTVNVADGNVMNSDDCSLRCRESRSNVRPDVVLPGIQVES